MKKNFLFSTALCIFVFLLFLAGCITVGKSFPVDPVRGIKIGQTTKQDALALFGKPWRTGIEDGDETWTYGHYQYRLFGNSNTCDLVLRFNKEDKVISYTYNSNYSEIKDTTLR